MGLTCSASRLPNGSNLMPRWSKVLLTLVIVTGVLAGLGEWGLRLAIPGIVQTAVREQLDLPRSTPVDVSLGGSALLAALGGGVGNVGVEVPDAPVADGVRASLKFHADRVPFAVTSGELSDATASIFVDAADLGPVISLLTGGVADSGKTNGGALTVGRSIDAFGFSVPIEATLKLSIVDGNVRVEPAGLSAVGFDLDASQLANATGGLLDPLLSPRLVCVADRLPAGITLRDVRVTTGGVRLDVALSDDFLSNDAARQLGTCAK